VQQRDANAQLPPITVDGQLAGQRLRAADAPNVKRSSGGSLPPHTAN
jgi:hypothetical protein